MSSGGARPGAWCSFLLSHCDIELEQLLAASPDSPQHSLLVDGSLLLDYNLNLCSTLLTNPRVELDNLNRYWARGIGMMGLKVL